MTEEEILQYLDAKSILDRERVRVVLREQGREDLVAELDRKYREIDNGIDGAKRTWGALSPIQRMALRWAFSRAFLRISPTKYRATLSGGKGDFRIATIRNLAARELLYWDGGAFDPESKALITERGRFVLKHGRD